MQSQEKLIEICVQQLKKQKSPEEIEELAIQADIPVHVIRKTFAHIYHDPYYMAVWFREKLKGFGHYKTKPGKSCWRNFGTSPTKERLLKKQRKMDVK